MKNLSAFQVKINNHFYDYRWGGKLNLNKVEEFFAPRYRVVKIWSGQRHVLGFLEKNQKTYFLKLATSRGIGLLTKNEYNWNESFNKEIKRDHSFFWVPQNYDHGYYHKSFFYLITDKLEGDFLTKNLIIKNLEKIIAFAKLIEELKNVNLDYTDSLESNYVKRFIAKARLWYENIPCDITKKYKVENLLKIIVENDFKFQQKNRHGDFTPWHLMSLKDGRLGLIDGEHAIKNGIEGYDLGYFIQRVFSVLKDPDLAKKIYYELRKEYNSQLIKIVLCARAIGGFLDESLVPDPDYRYAKDFQNWVINSL